MKFKILSKKKSHFNKYRELRINLTFDGEKTKTENVPVKKKF